MGRHKHLRYMVVHGCKILEKQDKCVKETIQQSEHYDTCDPFSENRPKCAETTINMCQKSSKTEPILDLSATLVLPFCKV